MDQITKNDVHTFTLESQPKPKTMDFLRQFARVYQVEPALRVELCGYVLN